MGRGEIGRLVEGRGELGGFSVGDAVWGKGCMDGCLAVEGQCANKISVL